MELHPKDRYDPELYVNHSDPVVSYT